MRIPVYLDPQEEAALRRVAEEHALSISAVLRYALRVLVGLPVGPYFPLEIRREDRRATD